MLPSYSRTKDNESNEAHLPTHQNGGRQFSGKISLHSINFQKTDMQLHGLD